MMTPKKVVCLFGCKKIEKRTKDLIIKLAMSWLPSNNKVLISRKDLFKEVGMLRISALVTRFVLSSDEGFLLKVFFW